MFRRTSVFAVAAVAGWLALPGPAWAVYPPPVKDDGKFFTKDGLDRANKKIREIYQKYKKDVVVETLEKLTPEQQKKYQEEEEKDRFFARLALDRGREIGLNGIYILIVKKPQFLRIHMDTDTQKKEFKAADRKKVLEKIIARFKEDSFDAGLLDGLDAIEAALKANMK